MSLSQLLNLNADHRVAIRTANLLSTYSADDLSYLLSNHEFEVLLSRHSIDIEGCNQGYVNDIKSYMA